MIYQPSLTLGTQGKHKKIKEILGKKTKHFHQYFSPLIHINIIYRKNFCMATKFNSDLQSDRRMS